MLLGCCCLSHACPIIHLVGNLKQCFGVKPCKCSHVNRSVVGFLWCQSLCQGQAEAAPQGLALMELAGIGSTRAARIGTAIFSGSGRVLIPLPLNFFFL